MKKPSKLPPSNNPNHSARVLCDKDLIAVIGGVELAKGRRVHKP